ncbi:MAG: helix-turn-helix domain-containing protein, partial [Limisphaerales bacterium]
MLHKDAMNQLNVSLQQSIITLWNHGWSFRRIARELQLRRETVSKYVHRHEDSKVLAGG